MKQRLLLAIAAMFIIGAGWVASTIDDLFFIGVFFIVVGLGVLLAVFIPPANYFD